MSFYGNGAPMDVYQWMPDLTPEEDEALRADIAENGVRVPIEVDEDGHILDGHHRKAIADELGVDCPQRVIDGLSEDQKQEWSRRVNLRRRHITPDQRQELAVRWYRDEGWTQQRIADELGVGQNTISGDLRGIIKNDNSPAPQSQGRGRPRKPKPEPEPPAPPEPEPNPEQSPEARLAEEVWQARAQQDDKEPDMTISDTKTPPEAPPEDRPRSKRERDRAERKVREAEEEAEWRQQIEARGGKLAGRDPRAPVLRYTSAERLRNALHECHLAIGKAMADPNIEEQMAELRDREMSMPAHARIDKLRSTLVARLSQPGSGAGGVYDLFRRLGMTKQQGNRG